jgi:hypothetical protein
MKNIKFLLIAFVTLSVFGCSKDGIKLSPLASLNFVNIVPNTSGAKINFTNLKGLYSSISSTTNYSASTPYAVNAGVLVPLTVVSSDTTKVLFTSSLRFGDGTMNSLFLSGDGANVVDALLIEDNPPYHPDSTFGVRFVNMCYGSNPISVTLTSNPTVDLYSSAIPYKSYSVFDTFNGASLSKPDTFQVRDLMSGVVLGTFPFTVATTPRFFNCTLVWKGITGATGTNAPGILRVNNY